MKYLALALLLLSCNMQTKQQPANTLQPTVADTSIHNQRDVDFDINAADTQRVNTVIDGLIKLHQIHIVDSSIKQATNGMHGASFLVYDGFNGDTAYYRIAVGDNSHEDHYATVYVFAMHKQTGAVKAYDITADSLMTVEAWQKMHP